MREGDLYSIKDAALVLLTIREQFFLTPDGRPDYSGRSFQYRQWYSDLVNSLNLDQDDRFKLMNRIRFHVGNAIRDKLSDHELKDAGLRPIKPADRGHSGYKKRSMLYKVASEEGPLNDDEKESCIDAIYTIMERLRQTELTKYEIATLSAAFTALTGDDM